MDHSCSGGSCGAVSHMGGACGGGGSCCSQSSCSGGSCCSGGGCSCGCGAEENCPGGDLYDAAKHAKKCLLKEKIKARLESKMGKKLDQMADMAVEILLAKWEMKKQKEEKMSSMTAKLGTILHGS